jgi:predicted phage terminase large subunit-like protein
MAKNREIFEALAEEGTKQFSTVKRGDKRLYGKTHGRDDLLAYAPYIEPTFLAPDHIKLIAKHLKAVEAGRIKRLIVNMPPRHGKSNLISKIFPSWYIGKHPADNILIASYGLSIAAPFTRWLRNTCESPEYREIFPKFSVAADSRARTQWDTTAGGKVVGAGADGPITGRGIELGIIDDPYKSYEEARSELQQEKLWEWYRSVFLTRLHPGGRIIVVHTRWTTNDLTAKLIETEGLVENGGKWTLLKLPGINPDGAALWPDRYSIDDLMSLRAAMGEGIFGALYQQEPVDQTERLFSEPMFEEPPADLPLFAYLDPAFGGADFSALTIGGTVQPTSSRRDDMIYIVAGAIWKTSVDVTYDRVEKICNRLNVRCIFYEANQAQKLLGTEFNRRGLRTRPVYSTVNKLLRIQNYARMNWSKIRWSRMVEAEYLKQVLSYSELARHDDAPDSLAGLIQSLGAGRTPLENRYNVFNRFLR